MGRIRTVKPEVFAHEGLYDAEQETKLPIRVAWIGLFTQCDREGRFQWRPRQLKAAVLPYDNLDFSRVLDALLTRGFVRQYRVNDELYGFIPTWKTHQFVNGKEPKSILPEPTQNESLDVCVTRDSRVNDACGTDGVKERKGKEENTRESRVNDGNNQPVIPVAFKLNEHQPVVGVDVAQKFMCEFSLTGLRREIADAVDQRMSLAKCDGMAACDELIEEYAQYLRDTESNLQYRKSPKSWLSTCNQNYKPKSKRVEPLTANERTHAGLCLEFGWEKKDPNTVRELLKIEWPKFKQAAKDNHNGVQA